MTCRRREAGRRPCAAVGLVLDGTIGGMSTVFLPADRPEVEVLVEDSWRYGELRMWRRGEDGSWLANVTWSRAPGENRIDTFPAETVRLLAGA